ncbi:MDR family MFS transporter [Paenibacillus graminis]|uniref:MFS transporter n=1 Tax=Paenibacillus graminis TaxID=189425 RepID=A0A089MA30_9BACL|nr:MDR family MFS transporter [Paenibacillus graminis]AIQ70117.1 MFS transporter [Paenibacillus graminis]
MMNAAEKPEPAPVQEFSVRAILPVVFALIVGMLLVMLNTTIMNVAIPRLQNDFGTGLKTIQWAITGYTLALSVVVPLAGWSSDRFTAKRAFLLSITLFTAGSVLCAVAQSPAQLIVFRIIQGLGGGMVFPIGMALSFKIAPPDKRGSIMGLLGLPMLVAPLLGPVLSGWLIEYVNWHWIFLINLPIGIIALMLGMKYLPDSEKKANTKLDIRGLLLSPAAFAGLVFAIHRGGSEGWGDTYTIIALIGSLTALVLFIIIELSQQNALLELRSFRSFDFTKGIVLSWVNQIALFGSILLIPLFLQQVRGFSSFESGLLIIPQAVMSFIAMIIGGKLFDKIGARPVVFSGLVILSTALYLLSGLQADTSVYVMMSYFAILGLGQGLGTMTLNNHILQSAPKDFISRVTPLISSGQQVFVSFSVAIMTGLLTSSITRNMNLGTDPVAAQVAGFHHTFQTALILALCGLVLSLFLSKPKLK